MDPESRGVGADCEAEEKEGRCAEDEYGRELSLRPPLEQEFFVESCQKLHLVTLGKAGHGQAALCG